MGLFDIFKKKEKISKINNNNQKVLSRQHFKTFGKINKKYIENERSIENKQENPRGNTSKFWKKENIKKNISKNKHKVTIYYT